MPPLPGPALDLWVDSVLERNPALAEARATGEVLVSLVRGGVRLVEMMTKSGAEGDGDDERADARPPRILASDAHATVEYESIIGSAHADGYARIPQGDETIALPDPSIWESLPWDEEEA